MLAKIGNSADIRIFLFKLRYNNMTQLIKLTSTAKKIPDRKGSTLAKAVIAALSQLPKGAVKTITCDRGSAFANWREIESALDCQMYFADPYCAWQKGTNENLNGLLREFYPKGHNLSRVSPKTLEKNLALINARPKKILNFQNP